MTATVLAGTGGPRLSAEFNIHMSLHPSEYTRAVISAISTLIHFALPLLFSRAACLGFCDGKRAVYFECNGATITGTEPSRARRCAPSRKTEVTPNHQHNSRQLDNSVFERIERRGNLAATVSFACSV